MVTHALTRSIIFKFNKGYSGCHCRLAVVGLRTAVGLPQYDLPLLFLPQLVDRCWSSDRSWLATVGFAAVGLPSLICHCSLAVVGLRAAVGLPQSVYHAPYSIPIAQCLR